LRDPVKRIASHALEETMQPEPILDLAHLGHMELLTPKPDESLKFFVDVMGMTVSGQKGESVYLRGWTITSAIRSSSRRRKPPAWSTWRCARAASRRWSAASPR
jgi:catechol 2,3-dioxygenase